MSEVFFFFCFQKTLGKKMETQAARFLPTQVYETKRNEENRKWKSDPQKGNKTDFYRIYIREAAKQL